MHSLLLFSLWTIDTHLGCQSLDGRITHALQQKIYRDWLLRGTEYDSQYLISFKEEIFVANNVLSYTLLFFFGVLSDTRNQ